MKKIIYYLCFIFLLFLISIIPTSAKENKTCIRTKDNLRVREKFIQNNNLNDILNTPCIDEVEKVYDFADLLTDTEETDLYNEAMDYIKNTNYDLAIVTINENPKKSEVEYADDFYDYNNFGLTDTRDGLVLLIDMDNRQLYISTTGYAIKMYDDNRIEGILDSGYSYIKQEMYYNTLSEMIKTLKVYYDKGYPASNSNLNIDSNGNVSYIKYISYPLVIILSSIITLIISLILYNMSRLKIKVLSTVSYLKNKNLSTKEDHLYNTIVTHHLRSSDSSSSGGGGGSSFHTSSSGSSHGGGGRGF